MPTTRVPADGAQFADTHWSLILKAQRDDESGASALNELCQAYRLPIYAYIRHRGATPHDAEDLTQSFFVDFLNRRGLQRADSSKARFRAFLLASLKNFLMNEWDRQRALKRGGGSAHVSFNDPAAEAAYKDLASPNLESDKLYDRAWARSKLDNALRDVREAYAAEGRVSTFDALKSVLSKEGRSVSYGVVASELGITEEAARMAGSRIRRRFGESLRREILRTVSDPQEVKEELRYLLSCW